ncbi:MAG: ATPase [Oscillospiraceae bacterium]|nr:ATPase [Oscillospiraceae bacterium]
MRALGVELGSTRIKAVLVDGSHRPVWSGSHGWENRLEDGVWTYHLEDVWTGLQDALAGLDAAPGPDVLGISAMMHGYLAFDRDGRLLAPFRTWRNTCTGQAAGELSALFGFNIPQRWSVAHLYQAILNGEAHVQNVAYLTTLAGYVHWRLTGETVLGIGDASGMFPVDGGDYHPGMLAQFDALLAAKGIRWRLRDVLPRVLTAGEPAGCLTREGAALLGGNLSAGLPLCPPEGDAGTGMVATNSVAARTGNISAGTSIFAMAVLEQPLPRVHSEIDIVATPAGRPVAMVHCNNCTTDIDAWAGLLREASGASPEVTYALFYRSALAGEADAGGLLAYNYYGGEHITGLEAGRPLFCRLPESRLTLPNFCRCLLFSAMASLRIGMDILTADGMRLDRLLGHGGLFKAGSAGQTLMAAALRTPVAVMETAGEGGAWGIALLAAFLLRREGDEPLEDYLARRVFAAEHGRTVAPAPADMAGFETFLERYRAGLGIERAAVDCLRG